MPGNRIVTVTSFFSSGSTSEAVYDHDADKLAAFLCHTSHLNVALWPLPSGKSSNVTGNLTFCWSRDSNPHTGDFQFQVEEKDVKVFALGTSSAVL